MAVKICLKNGRCFTCNTSSVNEVAEHVSDEKNKTMFCCLKRNKYESTFCVRTSEIASWEEVPKRGTDDEDKPTDLEDGCTTVDPSQGGVTLELSEGMVFHVKKGKLYTCTCSENKFECHTNDDGNTWCLTKCVSWNCKEISANDIVNKAIINELTKE